MRGNLGAAELELLDDVGDLLESVRVPVGVPLGVGDHEERRLLEQQHLDGRKVGKRIRLRSAPATSLFMVMEFRIPGQITRLLCSRQTR